MGGNSGQTLLKAKICEQHVLKTHFVYACSRKRTSPVENRAQRRLKTDTMQCLCMQSSVRPVFSREPTTSSKSLRPGHEMLRTQHLSPSHEVQGMRFALIDSGPLNTEKPVKGSQPCCCSNPQRTTLAKPVHDNIYPSKNTNHHM